MHNDSPLPAAFILSGGLALGAYQAGAIITFCESGRLDLQAIAGSSIGAFAAAILAGNPPERRIERLRRFWDAMASEPSGPAIPWAGPFRQAANWMHVLGARTGGNPGAFRLRGFGKGEGEGPSLYDAAPARALLQDLVDFGLLNAGPVRCCIAATDIVSGETRWFDTAAGDRITADHLLASGGLIPAFQPVRIDGALLGDGGLSANMPLEPFLASDRRSGVPSLCLSIDCFAPDGAAPTTLEQSAERSTDLKFATQTVRRIDGLVRERALEARLDSGAEGARLLYLSYRPEQPEAGPEKQYDFSRASLEGRMRTGAADAGAALAALRSLERPAPAGLHVTRIRR